jgi:hypothetical protein
MEFTKASSPVSPGPADELLSREWEQRQLNVETCFDIVGEFKEKAPVKWALRQIKKHRLMPLLRPGNDFLYGPFVRLFYKNLKFDTDIPPYLSSTILGQEVYVGVTKITASIDCPYDDPQARFGEYPHHYDLHFIITDMFGGEYALVLRDPSCHITYCSLILC